MVRTPKRQKKSEKETCYLPKQPHLDTQGREYAVHNRVESDGQGAPLQPHLKKMQTLFKGEILYHVQTGKCHPEQTQ